MTPGEEAVVDDYLHMKPIGASPQTVSTMWAILGDVWPVSGRNRFNGAPVNPAEPQHYWLAVVGYMVFFDQIGTALLRPSQPSQRPGFRRCLAHFTTLTSDEQDTLYALRCALAHDYSLINKQGNQALWRAFTLHGGEMLIRPAPVPWDGAYPPKKEMATAVGIKAVGDLALDIVGHADSLFPGDLGIDLPGGVHEMRSRYFYIF